MKSKITLKLALMLILLPVVASAQLITTTRTTTGSFHDLVTLMSYSASELFVPESTGPYSEFIFTTDGFFSSSFIPNPTPSYSSFGFDLLFKEVENPESFILATFANIGFIGNESGDRNKLFMSEVQEEVIVQTTKLFDYRGANANNNVTPAPYSYDIVNTGQEPVEMFFSHLNPVKGSNTQSDPNRFRIFQAFDPLTDTEQTQWIFAIDDREDSLIDFDDGFFFLSGNNSITPVPEPSVIGALSVIGLGGVLWLRKRFVKKQ